MCGSVHMCVGFLLGQSGVCVMRTPQLPGRSPWGSSTLAHAAPCPSCIPKQTILLCCNGKQALKQHAWQLVLLAALVASTTYAACAFLSGHLLIIHMGLPLTSAGVHRQPGGRSGHRGGAAPAVQQHHGRSIPRPGAPLQSNGFIFLALHAHNTCKHVACEQDNGIV